MSTYEMKDGQGSLFKNDRKEKETQPDYTGKIMVNGTMYQLAAWVKESKSGLKFMSLNAQLPREQSEAAPAASAQSNPGDGTELPF